MTDLNSVASVQETSAPKKSQLLKKIIMPLIGTSRSDPSQFNSIFNLPFGLTSSSFLGGFTAGASSSTLQAALPITSGSAGSQSSLGTIFDNDFRFQKFIVFIVDFIHIIYDKISDQPISNASYDVNDELSIFSFAILTHSLSLGLVSSVFFKRFIYLETSFLVQ